MKSLNRIWLCLLVVLLSSFAFLLSSCFAEAQYRITESELTRLESNLTELSELNRASQNELMMLKNNLEISRNELNEAKQQTIELESKLTELRKISNEQEQSLLIVNERLQQLGQEEKRKISRVKRQRNIAYAVIAVGAYLYSRK